MYDFLYFEIFLYSKEKQGHQTNIVVSFVVFYYLYSDIWFSKYYIKWTLFAHPVDFPNICRTYTNMYNMSQPMFEHLSLFILYVLVSKGMRWHLFCNILTAILDRNVRKLNEINKYKDAIFNMILITKGIQREEKSLGIANGIIKIKISYFIDSLEVTFYSLWNIFQFFNC